MNGKAFLKALYYTVVSFTVVIVLWQVAIMVWRPSDFLLPSPLAVLRALVAWVVDGTLALGLRDSLGRFIVGYSAAVAVGVAFGLLLGLCNSLFRYAYPLIQLVRPIAPVAWMPFIVLLLGIGDAPAIVIIFLAGFFPVLLTTASATHRIDPIYAKVAANYGMARSAYVFRIVLPAIFPQIANSLHIALGTSWIFLVSGEMMGAQTGLGYMIIDARNNMRTDQLLATMIVIGAAGFALDLLVGRLTSSVLKRWGAAA